MIDDSSDEKIEFAEENKEEKEEFEVVDLGDLDPDESSRLDPIKAVQLMKPPLTKEKVVKFLEETKETWGRESVDLKEKIKNQY